MQAKDSRYRFLLENSNIRGVVVYLNDTWREVLGRADYPVGVREILGHAMVAMPLLASTVKFGGRMTLQAKGSGPVTLLVVQATAEGTQRGMAHWSGDAPMTPLAAVLGDATLSIQIETGKRGEIYQGVVDAHGQQLQDALAHYFQNSEQLQTRLWLMCDGEQAAGILVQALPDADPASDDWDRVVHLVDTVNASELFDTAPETLLRRLFHEDQARLFDAEPLRFACGCSRERTAALIQGLGRAEADSILAEQGSIEITCEFCNSRNVFDEVDVEAIFRDSGGAQGSTTLH
jgi:molecular chaperone Hsp33